MKKYPLSFIFHRTLRYKFILSMLFYIILNLIKPVVKVYAQKTYSENSFLYPNATIFILLCIALFAICILSVILLFRVKKSSNKKIKEASLELRHITNSIHAGFVHFFLEENYEMIYASNGYYDMIGYSKEEIRISFKNSLAALALPGELEKFHVLRKGFRKGEYIQKEIRMTTKCGKAIWILLNGNYIVNKDGKRTLSAVLVDITESRLMQERLLLEEERYRVAAEISNDILFEYKINNDLMIFADKYKELYGRDSIISEFTNIAIHEGIMIHPEDIGVFAEYCRVLQSGKEMIESEFRIKDINNEYVWCHTRGKTIFDDNKHPIRVIGKIVNIDLHKKELQKLEYKAKRDPLTGVYNKSTTKELIDQFIVKNPDSNHIFMIVDIDDFKSINDRYGHLRGDKILSFVISQVKLIFSAEEIIGRIGGDEFSVFIGNIANQESIIIKADLLQRALRTVYKEEHYEISVSGSIGVSMYPNDGKNYNQLLNCADKALYDVKDQGKDGYKLFT